MKRDEALHILTLHQQDLSTFGIKRLAVFGSVARDSARPTSDVDVLVEFDGPPTFDGYIDLNVYLETLLQRPVDLVTAASLRESWRDAIEQEACDVPELRPLSR